MSDKILKLVGARIRDLRKEKGLSQEQLGEKAGFHFSYIGGVERAEKNISLINLGKIAQALGVETYELFTYSNTFKLTKSEKETEISDILNTLLRMDSKDVRRIRTIINEFTRN